MTETIVNFFIDTLGGINKYLIVFIISLFPILELRGGLIAASLFKLNFVQSFLVSFIGNILPIPLILLCIEWIFKQMKKWKPTKKIVLWCEKKSLSKRDQIDKYGYLGLLIFVGIPLPGTGAWTGALLAVLLGMDKKKAFIVITLGVLMAGIIMSILSFGILGNLI